MHRQRFAQRDRRGLHRRGQLPILCAHWPRVRSYRTAVQRSELISAPAAATAAASATTLGTLDYLAIAGFALAAVIGIASIRDKSRPRAGLGWSLLVLAAVGFMRWLGTEFEFPITVAGEGDEPDQVVEIPVLRTVMEIAVASAIAGIAVRAIDIWRVGTGAEPLLMLQRTVLWLGLVLLGVVAVYQVHFAEDLPIRTLVLSVGGASVFIIGLALQSALGNVFAGYSLQATKVIRKGDMVQFGHDGPVGTVYDSTMSTTRILLRDGEMLVLPNNAVLQRNLLNLDMPFRRLRLSVTFRMGHDTPPATVKDVALGVLRSEPLVLADPEPEVWTAAFGEYAIEYDARFWVGSYRDRDQALDRVRTRLWYALRDAGLDIPVPERTVRIPGADEERAKDLQREQRIAQAFNALSQCELFCDESVTTAERRELARDAHECAYAPGERIVRKGDSSDSMYVVVGGSCEVALGGSRDVRILEGGHFGEIALVLRQPRTADVVAGPEGASVLRLPRPSVAPLLLQRPEFRARVGDIASERHEETTGARSTLDLVKAPIGMAAAMLRLVRPW
jgi:small-conductance mechanosensitive channel